MANNNKLTDVFIEASAKLSSAKLVTDIGGKNSIFTPAMPISRDVSNYENMKFGFEQPAKQQLPNKEYTASNVNIFNPKPSLNVRASKRKDKDQAPVYSANKILGY
jgi:hypothetical protein